MPICATNGVKLMLIAAGPNPAAHTTAAHVADSVGLSRSTFEEHLRKAENSLLGGLAPYLELHVRTRAKRKVEAAAQ